eukprot:269187-Pyramimonas_sp.AAC.1
MAFTTEENSMSKLPSPGGFNPPGGTSRGPPAPGLPLEATRQHRQGRPAPDPLLTRQGKRGRVSGIRESRACVAGPVNVDVMGANADATGVSVDVMGISVVK